jgi:hypothetical protein
MSAAPQCSFASLDPLSEGAETNPCTRPVAWMRQLPFMKMFFCDAHREKEDPQGLRSAGAGNALAAHVGRLNVALARGNLA